MTSLYFKEKTFIQVTSAQKELLRLLEHKEAPDSESLKMVHYLRGNF